MKLNLQVLKLSDSCQMNNKLNCGAVRIYCCFSCGSTGGGKTEVPGVLSWKWASRLPLRSVWVTSTEFVLVSQQQRPLSVHPPHVHTRCQDIWGQSPAEHLDRWCRNWAPPPTLMQSNISYSQRLALIETLLKPGTSERRLTLPLSHCRTQVWNFDLLLLKRCFTHSLLNSEAASQWQCKR